SVAFPLVWPDRGGGTRPAASPGPFFCSGAPPDPSQKGSGPRRNNRRPGRSSPAGTQAVPNPIPEESGSSGDAGTVRRRTVPRRAHGRPGAAVPVRRRTVLSAFAGNFSAAQNFGAVFSSIIQTIPSPARRLCGYGRGNGIMVTWTGGIFNRTGESNLRPLWKLALAALVVALALAACGKDKRAVPEPSPTETPAPSPTPTVETPEPVSPTPAFVAPLTGLPVEQPPSFRQFNVMINNYAAARPQSGLTYADGEWEVLAEGGITRLMAVFHSRDFSDPIGPIRSIRPYLIDLGEMYGGV